MKIGSCGYKLPINVQNFMQKDSTQAKIVESHRGDTFLTHPVQTGAGAGRPGSNSWGW